MDKVFSHSVYLWNQGWIKSLWGAWRGNFVVSKICVSLNLCFRTIHRLNWKENKSNKSTTMMRGKSPRSDVEMTNKLNFVAAILDFWRAFLNQFWPNTYKIHFWISFVLCVVFKCQYFWSYSRKTHFYHLYTYFKGP